MLLSTFQRVMSRVLQPHIGKFVLVYIDDILVFSITAQEHAQHLRTVLQILREHQLECKLSKSEFNRPLTGRKATTFNWLHWGSDEVRAFHDVKHALTHASVLAIPDLNAEGMSLRIQ